MQPPPPLPLDAALFLDFDGTLVDLADTPDAIAPPPDLVPLLGALQALLHGALAVVSGRTIDALDRYLAPLAFAAAGEHGAQWRDAAGRVHRMTTPLAALDGVQAATEALAARHPGLLVERKQAAVALHYRAAPELATLCHDALAQAVAALPQLELLHGKCVVEVKPAGADKGIAIERFLQQAPFAGRVPVFAGDDVTDEHGFAAVLRRGGVAIKVGPGASQAPCRLASPREVRTWLAAACAPTAVAPRHPQQSPA